MSKCLDSRVFFRHAPFGFGVDGGGAFNPLLTVVISVPAFGFPHGPKRMLPRNFAQTEIPRRYASMRFDAKISTDKKISTFI